MKACLRITTLAVRWVLSPRHWPESCLRRAMVALDPVVLVLAGDVQRGRNQLLDHVRQSRRPVGDDLSRGTVDGQRSGEERLRRGDIAAGGRSEGPRHVTATGIPSTASSRTSGYIISPEVRLQQIRGGLAQDLVLLL
jgi:hypothetical protein